ncbi:hypothetical protein [Aeromicrobium sp. CF3.5]|uniref:hypothetical protein n=1 Tax=Aeromicrobium sp. CF3.5 TaxID=3373078 RepID=UPI003EE46F7B
MIIPFGPAEAAAIAAGALAHGDVVPLWAAVLVVAAGMLGGDFATYAAAGPMLGRARRLRERRPHFSALLSILATRPLCSDVGLAALRFIPGARTPTALMAREFGTTRTHFCVIVGVGSLLWAGLWTGGGSALADGAVNLITR